MNSTQSHNNPVTMGKNMYKVWNSTRTQKKSLVASSLKELLAKGSEKLGYSEPMTVVLEEDGTVIEDEDCFELLEANTMFTLLTDGETWKPLWETAASGVDTVDHSIASDTPRIEQLASILRAKPSMLVTLNKQDLQEIVDTNTSHLTSLLGGKPSKTTSIQDACQHYLDEEFKAEEGMRLVHLLAQSTQGADRGEGKVVVGVNRPKLDN